MLRKRCAGPLLLVLLTVTGCQLTQSAFSRTVGNAGAVFSAASTTLSYAHEGKITSAYAQASFVNYQSELDGLDQQLPSQQGAPDKRTVQHLLDLYRPAIQAVIHPCLEESCHWQAPVWAFNRSRPGFPVAGGGRIKGLQLSVGLVREPV